MTINSHLFFSLLLLWFQGGVIGVSVTYILDEGINKRKLVAYSLLCASCSPIAAGISVYALGKYDLVMVLSIGVGVALLISVVGVNGLRMILERLTVLVCDLLRSKLKK